MSLVLQAADAITPVATVLHAQGQRQNQQRLFVEGGRYNLLISLFFLFGFLLLGKQFIAVWVGPQFASSYVLLAILALGETLPNSQMISRSVVLGMGHPKLLAWANVVENVVTIVVAAAVAPYAGLVGIAVTYAVCGALGRGVVQICIVCRLVELPVRAYAARVIVPALAISAAPAAFLAALVWWRSPTGWGGIVGYGGAYALCYAAACASIFWLPRHRGWGAAPAGLAAPVVPRSV
jgi:O-antigen/teichoic acid export membrane protein